MDRANRTVAFALLALCIVAVICNIRLVRASGPIYIRADGSVDPPGSPLQRSGDLYTLTANITSSVDGIVVEKSNVIMDGNGYTVQGGASEHAFYLYGINNVTIRNTRIEGFSYGIYLESTSQNAIYENNITGSTLDGIGLYDAQGNIISFNNIEENGWSGIGLYFSHGNNISENCITNNYYGVNFFDSQNNSILHNSFINNTNQTSSDASPNIWDDEYPSCGNYWNDHIRTDNYRGSNQNETGSDGICDTAYIIDSNNRDNYPLTKHYGGVDDIGVVNVTTSKTVVSQGYRLDVTVKAVNYGTNNEILSLTAYANTTAINQTQTTLTRRNSTTITLSWNTVGFAKGNYIISAYAWPVPSETDTADNKLIDGEVMISKLGDLNLDGIVNYKDASLFRQAYIGAYNYLADFNQDGVINYKDASLFRGYYIG